MVETAENVFRIADNNIRVLDGNIIHIKAYGDQHDEIAEEHYLLHKQLSRQLEGKLNYLVDLNHAGKSTPTARKVWKKLSESEFTDKVALWGLHPVARILATFVMGVTRKKEMKFFTSMEEAVAWLGIPQGSVI